MDFKKWIQEAVAILKFEEGAVVRTANDVDATLPAILFVAIGGAASVIGTLNPIALANVLLAPLFFAIGVGLVWFIAKLFGGNGSFEQVLRPTGLANLANWVNVVPILGPMVGVLAALWVLAVAVVTIEKTQELSIGQACIVVIVPFILCCGAIGGLVALGVGGAMMSGMAWE